MHHRSDEDEVERSELGNMGSAYQHRHRQIILRVSIIQHIYYIDIYLCSDSGRVSVC